METITLLHMLNEYPESSKDNQLSQTFPVLSSIYQLPFQRERQIVENLAFLSATTSDSARVMAVCLEEARDRGSCTIRLNIVTLTNDVQANSKDDDTKALLRCIITLDYCRILSWLRS